MIDFNSFDELFSFYLDEWSYHDEGKRDKDEGGLSPFIRAYILPLSSKAHTFSVQIIELTQQWYSAEIAAQMVQNLHNPFWGRGFQASKSSPLKVQLNSELVLKELRIMLQEFEAMKRF